MNDIRIWALLLFFLQVQVVGQENQNLFPNGDVENVMSTLFILDSRYESHLETNETGLPSFWRLSEGAALCKDGYSGGNAIKISCQENEVTATVYSDRFNVEDADMPFGLPLVPDREIIVSFRYKTSGLKGKSAFSALMKLGVIEELPTREIPLDLPASKEWSLVSRKITLSEIKWGGEIVFALDGDKKNRGEVWIDDVYLGQQLEGVNLVKNHSFEKGNASNEIPPDWQIPLEDQWVSWVGARYREPVIDADESLGGHRSLRADVVYADGSGVAQRIHLNQHKIKPIVVELWSKLNNVINSKTYSPITKDTYSNLTAYVYHHDGTMQEVSPMLSLGLADHDWCFRRFGFVPQKPVKEIILQIMLLGSEYTTSLWVDEVKAYELGSTPEELEVRGVDLPARSIWSKWGGDGQQSEGTGIQIMNDDKNLYLTIPEKYRGQEISIYLNPNTQSTFVNHFRYLFDVIKLDADGVAYKGTTIEKQGYTADGEFSLATESGIESRRSGNDYLITIPYKALEMKGIPSQPFGFNVMWKNNDQKIFWSGKAANNREMGRIVLSKAPGVRIKSIQFGQRYNKVKGPLKDFVSQPPLYAGSNQAVIMLTNEGPDCQVELVGGIADEQEVRKNVHMKHQEVNRVTLNYQAGLEALTAFNLTLTVNGEQKTVRSYPIQVPAAIGMVLDQEFYYPEEDSAFLEIHNRYRPIPREGKVQIEVTDLKDRHIIQTITQKLTDTISLIPLDIQDIRVNPLPVQDYSVTVRYLDEDQRVLGVQTKQFGKINHTKRRELPPIDKLTIDDQGRIIINEDFRFFPIVVSDHIMEWGATIDMGANLLKSTYKIDSTKYKDRDKAWEKNAYTLYIGPYTPEEFDQFEAEAEDLIVHPGVLSTYNHQFYYWKLSDEWIDFRKRVEMFMGKLSSPRLVIWGHHDSSFLYDRDLPKWPNTNNPPVGYCYVKIMGRPGLGWRNTPFQTRTEELLDPGRFKLAEVNYYVSAHYDEILPGHGAINLSLRADDWHGVRNESYLSIIYGATGLYHWIIMQDEKVERLRGWLQELNYMWPVFVADDAENKIEILPNDSKLDARLKIWQGKYYLLVANRGEAIQKASIHIDGFEGMKVEKLFELPGSMSVKGGVIDDVWKQYDVHVYEIENVKTNEF